MKTIERKTMTNNRFPRPELLLHPNIPKPLHGINPRTILGQKWWNAQRQLAYAEHDYHCWACGVHKTSAKYHRWLEAHEVYDIDYGTGRVEMKEVCALCHSCHQYIHDGRMQKLFEQGKLSFEKYIDILAHGERLVKDYLTEMAINYRGQTWKKPFEGSLPFQNTFPDVTVPGLPRPVQSQVDWQEWHLVVEGREYYTRFSDVQEWTDYYQWLHRNNLTDNFQIFARFQESK